MAKINIFTLSGEILLKDNGVENQLNKIDNKAQGVHKSFGNMVGTAVKWAAVLGAAAAAGLGLMGKSALEGASSLEGYRNTLNVVMKDTKLAGETFAWAVDFANKTPFETDSIVQATVRLTSYGLKAREVMPAIGDMAGVMNKDIMSAVEAVADAQTGELERMKEFGITKQMIIDQGNKIMKGKELVNNKGQIVDQENFNKAMFSLMDEKFKGGMDLQANSFKGLWSTVTGVFKTSLAMMMGISSEGEVVIGGMFDTIKGKIKIVADTLTRWSTDGTMEKISKVFQSAFETIGTVLKVTYDFIKDNVIPIFVKLWDWIKPNIPAIKDAIKTAFDTSTDAIKKTIEVVKDVIDWCVKYQDILIPLAAGVAAGATAFGIYTLAIKAWRLATIIATGVGTAFGAVIAFITSPIGIVVIAIGLLVAAGVLLYRNWDTVSAFLKNIWKSIAQTATNVFNGIKDFLSGLWTGIKTTAINAWNGLKSAVSSIMSSTVSGAINIFNGVLSFFRNLPNTMQSLGSNMMNSLKNGISSMMSTIRSVVINGINTATSFITSLPGKALQWGKDFINGLKNGIMSAINGIADAVSGIASKIRGFLHFSTPDEGPLADYESWMPDFMGGLAKGIENSKYLVANAVKGLSSDVNIGMNLTPAMAGVGSTSSTQNQSPTKQGDNIINFNGNYSFAGQSDIDYLMNKAGLLVQRRKG